MATFFMCSTISWYRSACSESLAMKTWSSLLSLPPLPDIRCYAWMKRRRRRDEKNETDETTLEESKRMDEIQLHSTKRMITARLRPCGKSARKRHALRESRSKWLNDSPRVCPESGPTPQRRALGSLLAGMPSCVRSILLPK